MRRLMILVLGLAAVAAAGCDDGASGGTHGAGADDGWSHSSDCGGGRVTVGGDRSGTIVVTRDGTWYSGQ